MCVILNFPVFVLRCADECIKSMHTSAQADCMLTKVYQSKVF